MADLYSLYKKKKRKKEKRKKEDRWGEPLPLISPSLPLSIPFLFDQGIFTANFSYYTKHFARKRSLIVDTSYTMVNREIFEWNSRRMKCKKISRVFRRIFFQPYASISISCNDSQRNFFIIALSFLWFFFFACCLNLTKSIYIYKG